MRLLKALRLLAAALFLLGLVLHLTVRDASGPLRALFYALPWPVMAAAWFAMALFWCRQRFARIAFTLLALGCGAAWLAQSYRTSPAQTPAGPTRPLKVLSWNMAHDKLPSKDLRMLLETFQPDIAGMVEVGSRHSDPAALLTALPHGYTARKLDHAMAIVVRGSVRLLHQVEMGHVSKFASLEATVDVAVWHVFIVDGASHPLASRADVLSRVLSEAQGNPHTVIMGDFNTPFESALFDPWRAELHHAFHVAGRGFRETWPRPVPVLTIDHVWSSHDAPPLRAEKRWLPSSDHAALLVELDPHQPPSR